MQKRQNWIYIFLAFFILSFLVFLLFKLPILRPISSLTQNIFTPIESLTHKITFDFGSNPQIAKLNAQNLNLAKKLVDSKKLELDNRALRDQFSTQFPSSHNLLIANIIGSPSFIPQVSFPESFILDKGEKDGVKVGQAVIYKDNLIGKIIETSSNLSKVNLITASNFSLTVQTLNTESHGVLKGQGGGNMILDNIILSQNLKQDDFVITKGDVDLNSVGVLPNLIVGKIVSINKNQSSLFQTAKVQSLLDFSHLSIVFIIKNL